MGPERLKRINGSVTKPVDTLSVKQFEPRNEPEVPAAKRQKKDNTRTYGETSHYFEPSRAKKAIHEVLIDDDTIDHRSNSSAGNAGSGILALREYRALDNKVQAGKKSTRRRRSRTGSSLTSPLNGAANTRPDVFRSPAFPKRGTLISVQDSPDALGAQEPDAGPANVTSDLFSHSSTKRGRSYLPRPQFKRQKPSTTKEPIDISEDELQVEPTRRGGASSQSSALPRPSGTSGAPAKISMRGDIRPTNFEKSSRCSSAESMSISRAVCGKSIYSRDDSRSAVLLRRGMKEARRLEPVSENGQRLDEYAWLGIDLDQVRQFGTSEDTHYAFVLRSQRGDAGPKLYLEFGDHNGLEAFREALKSSGAAEKFISELEKKAEKAFTEAENWIALNATSKTNSRTFASDKKEEDAIPAPSSPDRRSGSNRSKLVDSLMQSAKTSQDSLAAQRPEEELGFGFDLRRLTRSYEPSTRRRMPSPETWTALHPDWHESWQAPLIFPPTGKNRATVDKVDIPRLDEGEFLNDNLINFYIRYLEHRLEKDRPELLRKIYFFSTFFFEKLKSTKGKINYDGVKSWTAKVDLLSYDYIIVPVNENAHWYLAIICNVPNAVKAVPEDKKREASTTPIPDAVEVADAPRSPHLSSVERNLTDISLEDGAAATAAPREKADDVSSCGGIASSVARFAPLKKRKATSSTPPKFDPTQPRIITLDSLGNAHAPTCKALKEYLIEEAKAKKGIDLTTVPSGMTARGIPEQNNYCDCGVFILAYMEEFLANPDEAARKLLMREDLGWNIRPTDIRNSIRELLFDLQAEQQKRHKQLEEEKKLRRAKRKSLVETSPEASSPLKPVILSPPVPKIPGSFPSESPERKSASETARSSPQSAQEANHREGGGLNGEAPDQAAEPQPKRKSSEGPRFVSPLSFDKIVVELKPPKGFDRSEFVTSSDDVQIMKETSVSPSEHKGSSNMTAKRRRRHSSVEEVEAPTARPASSSRMQKQGNKSSTSSSSRLPRQSIECIGSDGDQPKYDGIDRSSKPIEAIIL
ncbi:cysteine proteinase [Trichoderma aethiopicum]